VRRMNGRLTVVLGPAVLKDIGNFSLFEKDSSVVDSVNLRWKKEDMAKTSDGLLLENSLSTGLDNSHPGRG
jgi:hypothetical protein